MATRKLGKLKGVNISRIVKPVGVRIRCEFFSADTEIIEFEASGDLALALAKEMEKLLPSSKRTSNLPPSSGRKKGKTG